MPMTLTQSLALALVQIVAIIGFIMVLVPMLTFAERKVIAYIQVRLGATRTAGGHTGLTGALNKGMWALGKVPFLSILRGIPVFAADGLKLVTKEDIIPAKADKFVFVISPAISMVAAFTVFAAVCFAPHALFVFPASVPVLGGLPFMGYLTDINVGLLFVLGVASVGVYGIVLAGWASNSKYPLLGGLRSAAQIVSYEVPLTLSLLAPVVLAQSLNIRVMMEKLAMTTNPFGISALIFGFFIYTTCGFAETNRVPFDLAEAETELVSGFHTEYTGMKFGWFFLAEYASMVVVSALSAGFFLGGHYLLPFGLQGLWNAHVLSSLPAMLQWTGQPSLLLFLGKVFFLLFVFLWVRATLPRYRYDQLMYVGWKYLLPISLINLGIAALPTIYRILAKG